MRRKMVPGVVLLALWGFPGVTALAHPAPLATGSADQAALSADGPSQGPQPAAPGGRSAVEAEVAARVNAATEAYQAALDVETAARLLEEAVTMVLQHQLAGSTAATALALSGTTLLWMGQREGAIERFRMALACDPAVRIPPLWSGPEVEAALATARELGPLLPPPPPPPEALRHTPVTQQRWNHPVPISIQTNPDLPIVGATLYYRMRGERDWQFVQMKPIPGGFWGEIPCSVIQPHVWEYAINVVDAAGTVLGVAGTPDAPLEVAMSTGAVDPVPLRPDGTEAPSCLPDGRSAEAAAECPPGMECEPGAQACRPCVFDDDCLPGEICLRGCCSPPPREPGETELLGLFADIGTGAAVGIVGKVAEEPRWWYDEFTGRRMYGPDDERDRDEVGPGFALGGGAVRVGFGWFVVKAISIGLNFRIGFPFDLDYSGFPWLLEARGTWWFHLHDRHLLGVFLDAGGGVLVHRIPRAVFDQGFPFDGGQPCGGSSPARQCKVYEPFYMSSGYGSAGLGVQYYWMLLDWLGVGGELAMNAMFPDFSWNFDLLVNTRFAF